MMSDSEDDEKGDEFYEALLSQLDGSKVFERSSSCMAEAGRIAQVFDVAVPYLALYYEDIKVFPIISKGIAREPRGFGDIESLADFTRLNLDLDVEGMKVPVLYFLGYDCTDKFVLHQS